VVALYRWQGKQRSKVLADAGDLTQTQARRARQKLLVDLEAKRAALRARPRSARRPTAGWTVVAAAFACGRWKPMRAASTT
jgi:hypothetical protein